MKALSFLGFNTLILSSFITLSACHTTKKNIISTYKDSNYIQMDSTIVKNEAAQQFLKVYAQKKDSIMNEIIGHTEVPLSKSQPECTAGNFMADAQLEFAKKIDPKVVGSVINYGSIRINYIANGNLLLGNLYELMPFDNMLTIVEVPGSILEQFCNHIAKLNGWPIAGFSFEIESQKAVNILVNGQPIHKDVIYPIAMSDYLSTGGDDCEFLVSLKKVDHSVFIRDMLIEYVKQHKNIHPQIEKRISYVK